MRHETIEKWATGYTILANAIFRTNWPPDVKLFAAALRSFTYVPDGRLDCYVVDVILRDLTGLPWKRFKRARAWAVEHDLVNYVPGNGRGNASSYTLRHELLTWLPGQEKGIPSGLPLEKKVIGTDHLCKKRCTPGIAHKESKTQRSSEEKESPDSAAVRRASAPAAPRSGQGKKLETKKAPPKKSPRRWRPGDDWQAYLAKIEHALPKGPRGLTRDIANRAIGGGRLSAPQIRDLTDGMRTMAAKYRDYEKTEHHKRNADKLDGIADKLERGYKNTDNVEIV